WYMGALQVPWLPERTLLANDGALLRHALLTAGLSSDRAEHYVRRMREPRALASAVAWYSALPLSTNAVGRSRVPTTYLHGHRDLFFARASVTGTGAFVVAPFRSVGLDATHWLPEDAPDAVVGAVLNPPA